MGVRGLLKLLQSVPPEIVDFDAGAEIGSLVLLVDFFAFAFWVYNRCFAKGDFESIWASRDYSAVLNSAEGLVHRLLALGLRLEAVEDGAKGAGGPKELEAKLPEWRVRRQERVRDITAFKQWLAGNGNPPEGDMTPSLFAGAVKAGMQKAGVKVTIAEGEADGVLARMLHVKREGKTPVAVLGNDTDFVVMKGGRFVHLDNFDSGGLVLPKQPGSAAKKKSGREGKDASGFQLLVWTRQGLAKSLQVDEVVLPLAACLCGNDHSRALLERCRTRGLSTEDLPDKFAAIAKLLQTKVCSCAPSDSLLLETALDLLRPVLRENEEQEARSVLEEAVCFYELTEESAHGREVDHLALVRSEVQMGVLPKWALTVAMQGVYFTATPLEDPAIGSQSIVECLQHIRWCSLGLLAPEAASGDGSVELRVLGPSKRATFDDVRQRQELLGRLPQLRKLSRSQRTNNWEAFSRAVARTMAAPRKTSRPLETAATLLTQMVKANEGSTTVVALSSKTDGFLQKLLLLSLHLLANCGSCLQLEDKEFDALALMAFVLLYSPESVESYCSIQSANARRPSFRCVCLAEWFEALVIANLDLARVLGAASAQLPSAERLFHGPLFATALHKLRGVQEPQEAAHDLDSPGSSDSEECFFPATTGADGLLKVYDGPGFKRWRKEALSKTEGQLKKTVHQEAQPQDFAEPVPSQSPGNSGLPIAERKQELCKVLKQHRVVCVRGETGSGKSTQVPQYLLEIFPDARVVVTQPRRVAAVNLAKRVAAERNEPLGATVGFCIGGDKTAGSRLNFQTTGFLLRALCSDTRRLGRLTHVIFDEVHERSADADMLSLVVRMLLHRFPDVRLVVMSATLQGDLFRSYFKELQPEGTEVPAVAVGGRCYPVQHVYLDELQTFCKGKLSSSALSAVHSAQSLFKKNKLGQQVLMGYAKTCTPLIIDLIRHLAESGCTVLVFLPGMMDITTLYEEAKFAFEAEEGRPEGEGGNEWDYDERPSHRRGLKYRVFAMHSQIPMEDQQAAFKHPEKGVSHCVFASNVAESSLTLPSVAAVIDLGLHRRLGYDRRRRMTYLTLEFESKASAKQRSGRTGRTRDGVAVRLFPQRFLDTLPEFDPPEVTEAPLPRLYLQAKKLAMDLKDGGAYVDGTKHTSACGVLSDLVDPPDLACIEAVREELSSSGALTSADEEAPMTSLARVCLGLPFELNLCRLLWLGVHWGHAADAVILACSVAVQDPFSMPSSFTISNLSELGCKMRRSNASRHLFDGGTLSEPLAIRRLFLHFWRTLPGRRGEERLAGRKAWLRHVQRLAEHHAVMPRRLVELCNQVEDVARRLAGLCEEGCLAHKQLEELLQGLRPAATGSLSGAATQQEGEEGMFDASPTWDSEDEEQEEPEEKQKDYKDDDDWWTGSQRKWNYATARELPKWLFEPDVDMLRALLAAAFSDQMLYAKPRKPAAEREALQITQHGADLLRSVVMDLQGLPAYLNAPETISNLLSMATGSCEWEVAGMMGNKACLKLLEQSVVSPSSSSKPRSNKMGKSEAAVLADVSDHEIPPDFPCGVDCDVHVIHQMSRGRRTFRLEVEASSLGLSPKDMRQEESEEDDDYEDDESPMSPDLSTQKLLVELKKPSHPYQLNWVWSGAADQDNKGRGAAAVMAVPRVESPLGFLCDVCEGSESSRDGSWLACCSHVQGTESGGMVFVNSMTVLKPHQLRFFLLTLDAEQAYLSLGYHMGQDDGPVLAVIQLFGKQLPCRLCLTELELLEELRSDLRRSLLRAGKLRESQDKNLLLQYCQPDEEAASPRRRGPVVWHEAASAEGADASLEALGRLVKAELFAMSPTAGTSAGASAGTKSGKGRGAGLHRKAKAKDKDSAARAASMPARPSRTAAQTEDGEQASKGKSKPKGSHRKAMAKAGDKWVPRGTKQDVWF